MSSLSAGPA